MAKLNINALALGHQGVAEVLALAGYFTAVALAMKMYRIEPASD